MLDILLSGACGKMGKAVCEAVSGMPEMRVIAGIDVAAKSGAQFSFPVYASPGDFPGKAGCIVDFSHHTSAPALCAYAVATGTPLVVATTGHTPEETEAIKGASASIPVFYSRNMSLGVNLLIRLAKKAAEALGDSFDIEIIEKHHNQKVDAPSGTALMLAEAVSSALPYEPEFVYSRKENHAPRSKKEIGIHSIRGGTIVGEHDVLFAGQNEVVTLSHSAGSRAVFASGALRAASFLVGKPAGMYSMDDLIGAI